MGKGGTVGGWDLERSALEALLSSYKRRSQAVRLEAQLEGDRVLKASLLGSHSAYVEIVGDLEKALGYVAWLRSQASGVTEDV